MRTAHPADPAPVALDARPSDPALALHAAAAWASAAASPRARPSRSRVCHHGLGADGTGWLVAVSGRLEHQTWEKDGVKRSKHRVVASRVEFLAAPRNGASEPDVSDFEPAGADDDIPF